MSKTIAYICTIAALLCIFGLAMTSCTADGVYPSPTGEAVYIQGNSCVINMESDDWDAERFAADYQYCTIAHVCTEGQIGTNFDNPNQCINTLILGPNTDY